MKFLPPPSIGLFLLLLIVSSCQREELLQGAAIEPNNTSVTFREAPDIPSGPGETILGQELNNPYDLVNIENAASLLGLNTDDYKDPTHYYLKFLPTEGQHIINIDSFEKNTDYEFEVEPIHYEILYEGDDGYFDDDYADIGLMPEYGAVSAEDYDNGYLPDVPYEVLNEMYIPAYTTRLTFTAFVISGNEQYYDAIDGYCHPDCPNWPACLDNEQLTCVPDLPPNDLYLESVEPFVNLPRPNFPDYIKDKAMGYNGEIAAMKFCVEYINSPSDCGPISNVAGSVSLPGQPGVCKWECLGPVPIDPGPPPGFQEGCESCYVSTDRRKPGGRFVLVDTQTGEEGLRYVKVKATRGFWGFLWSNADTDENGCWNILNRRYNSRRAKVKIVFRDRVHDRMVIRSFRGANFWNAFLKPIKHKFRLRRRNRTWNNICIRLEDTNDANSQDREAFTAAVTNNAVHEYYDDFTEMPSPGKIAILIHNQNEMLNSAPMFRQIDQASFSVSGDILVYTHIYGLGSIPGLLWDISKPDMFLFFGFEGDFDGPLNGIRETDVFRRLVYHEMTHVSQYVVNGPMWWRENINYLVAVAIAEQPLPYGLGNLGGSGRTALIEGMAESHEQYLADQKYGLNHSNGGTPANTNRYANLGERLEFWDGAVAQGFNFIPEGLFFDLYDGVNQIDGLPIDIGNEPGFVNDQVEGIDFELQLQAFGPDVINLEDFQQELSQIPEVSTIVKGAFHAFAARPLS